MGVGDRGFGADVRQERPTTKEEEVMYAEEVRCWVVEGGHDRWMRPLQVTDDEAGEGRKEKGV